MNIRLRFWLSGNQLASPRKVIHAIEKSISNRSSTVSGRIALRYDISEGRSDPRAGAYPGAAARRRRGVAPARIRVGPWLSRAAQNAARA
jgi:hypothetical protein